MDQHNDCNVRLVYGGVGKGEAGVARKAGIPFGAHFRACRQTPVQRYEVKSMKGMTCKICGSLINKFCESLQQDEWICSICYQTNHRHPSIPQFQFSPHEHTYDILLPEPPSPNPNNYIFLVDLCVSHSELNAVKNSIIEVLQSAHQQTRVSLITFGEYVFVYNFRQPINTVVCLCGDIQYSKEELLDLLGAMSGVDAERKFVVGMQFREKVVKRVKGLKAEGEVKVVGSHRQRAKRTTGQALNIAISMSQLCSEPCRIVGCIGGPCTSGLGKVISTNFSESMRSLEDIEQGINLLYYNYAQKYYQCMREKILVKGTIIDLFVFSLEQVGLAQMYDLVRVSGGCLVLGEEFADHKNIFPKSFRKLLLQDDCGKNGVLSVVCSPGIMINGALGQCFPLKQSHNKYDSKKVVGMGGTNCWYIGHIDSTKTVTIVFQITNNRMIQGEEYVVQFRLTYVDARGNKILQCTTVQLQTTANAITQYFDEQSAILLMSRMFLYKSVHEKSTKHRQWLDKVLVQWAATFASYIKGDDQSFSLPAKMKCLPQYFYYLRKGALVRRLGISVDQLCYQSHLMNRESVDNCVRMIEPALLAYRLECLDPTPVNLEEGSMKEASILLLDTFLNVILWYGENIQAWEQEGYQHKQEYSHVKELLEAPTSDIQYLMQNRFPYPGFYKTHPNHSKERFLKSKISSTCSHHQNHLTDEIDLAGFTRYLIDLIVNEKLIQ